MIKVYIASPYTKGDVAVNVKRQMDCADREVEFAKSLDLPILHSIEELVKYYSD